MGMQLKEVTDPMEKDKTDSATDDNITLPKLKGGNTWIDFRDKIILKILRMQNRRLISFEYLIDERDRPVIKSNANLIVIPEIDLSNTEVFKRTQSISGLPTK